MAVDGARNVYFVNANDNTIDELPYAFVVASSKIGRPLPPDYLPGGAARD